MVVTQTDFLSIISSLSTDTAALAKVTAFEASVSSQLRAGQTVPNYLDGLPSGVRPFFASIVSQEYAILGSNGLTSIANQLPAATTGTSTAAAAARETRGLRAVGAVAVGLVGAVMAL